ncbi:MAG: right-handed parallel beta-helix repeat-containing protein [Phycisphaerales bacterium]|nr:right-handed parallel beta-helix repeat-containing protein [Phycisphaerales bacterium]
MWAEDCAFEGCTIESVGGAGLWIGEGCRGCSVRDSVVRDCGANGVMIGEAAGRVVDGGAWWQTAPSQTASGNTVDHCLIERCGQRFFGAVGVWIGLAERTAVSGCEIRELPYTGVSVGWRWDETPTPCRENRIEDNHIHHVMQTLSDGGGIYTLGRQPGTVLRGNAIHDVPANAGRAPSNGTFLDQGTTDVLIEGNTFWAIDTTPLRWHWTFANVVRRNTFVLAPGQAIAQYNRANEADIRYEENQAVEASGWSEGAASAIVEHAGPRP